MQLGPKTGDGVRHAVAAESGSARLHVRTRGQRALTKLLSLCAKIVSWFRTNQAQDNFLANVSHELRTPINAMLGMIDLMLDDPLTDTQQARLSIAKAAGDNLLVLIDDLLDFSNIEAGEVELASSEFSLRATLDESVGALRSLALQKGLLLQVELDPALPERVVGDAGRVRQVLVNLLSNAVKFTLQGRVSLRVDVAESHAERIAVRFEVSDTGIGIPAHKQAAIFQAFTQQDTSTTRAFGGTGLGLTIAMRLAAAMSGEISVESTPGLGSRFTFLAWFARSRSGMAVSPAPPPTAAPSRIPQGLGILVAEDNKLSAELMLQLIARRGHHGSSVTRGDDVLARLEQGDVDLLMLDLHMPGLDGFQVIEQIRARERSTGERLPVVAVTARARSADRERCLASGMDEFISKPVKASSLWSLVDHLLSSRLPDIPKLTPAWLDASVLLGACDGDPALLAKLCSSLRAQLPVELSRAAECLQKDDARGLRESAHKLYGMIAVVSTASASSEVAALEELAAGGALGEAALAFAHVKGLSELILSELDTLSIAYLEAIAAKRA